MPEESSPQGLGGQTVDSVMTVWYEARLRRQGSGLPELSQNPQGHGNPPEGLGMEEKGTRAWSRCAALNYYSGYGGWGVMRGRQERIAPWRWARRTPGIPALKWTQVQRCLGGDLGGTPWWTPSEE